MFDPLSWGNLILRHSGPGDTNMYIGALANERTDGRAQIWRNVGGTWTAMAAQPVFATSGRLRFEALGDLLSLYVNDTLVVSARDSSITGRGRVGVRSWGAGVRYDNLTATEIVAVIDEALETEVLLPADAVDAVIGEIVSQAGGDDTDEHWAASIGPVGLDRESIDSLAYDLIEAGRRRPGPG